VVKADVPAGGGDTLAPAARQLALVLRSMAGEPHKRQQRGANQRKRLRITL
jgi:hypothetical protein